MRLHGNKGSQTRPGALRARARHAPVAHNAPATQLLSMFPFRLGWQHRSCGAGRTAATSRAKHYRSPQARCPAARDRQKGGDLRGNREHRQHRGSLGRKDRPAQPSRRRRAALAILLCCPVSAPFVCRPTSGRSGPHRGLMRRLAQPMRSDRCSTARFQPHCSFTRANGPKPTPPTGPARLRPRRHRPRAPRGPTHRPRTVGTVTKTPHDHAGGPPAGRVPSPPWHVPPLPCHA